MLASRAARAWACYPAPMSATLRPVTLAGFLAWGERQELRHEFDGFRPVAMIGGTRTHSLIQRNLAIAVGGRLRGAACVYHGNDLKVEVAGRIRYPDGFVTCTRGARADTVEREPVVIFEVLSEGTQRTDWTTKNDEHRATPSVRRYVILDQEAIRATVFAREGEEWLGRILRAGDALALPKIGITMPLNELYEGVDLGAP